MGCLGGFCCCCFFFSCTSWPAKKYCQHLWTLLFLWPVAVTLLLPSLCQVYHWHRPLVDLWCTMVDQAVPNNMDLTAWTLEASVRRKITASPCSISGCAHKEAFCPGSRRLFLLLSFSQCSDWMHEPLSSMEMDSGKGVAESNSAALGGNSSKPSALSHLYILLFSITAWFFCQPSAHLLVTYHQSKIFSSVHPPFRLWNTFPETLLFASPVLSQHLWKTVLDGRQDYLKSLLEAKVGKLFWVPSRKCTGMVFKEVSCHFPSAGVAPFLLHCFPIITN